jgi:hypothetical protein
MAITTVLKVVPVANVANALKQLGDSRRAWFCMTKRGRVLKTPGRVVLAHPNRALLDRTLAEAESKAGLSLKTLSVYSMLCSMKDHFEKPSQEGASCKYDVLGDWTLRLCPGPEEVAQRARLGAVQRFFAANQLPRPVLSQSGDGSHQEQRLIDEGSAADMYAVISFFDTLWPTLSPARQCVVSHCAQIHGVFILGILLAQSECSAAEFADALLALRCVIPGVFGEFSESDVNSSREDILEQAKLMIQFRDLAEAEPVDSGAFVRTDSPVQAFHNGPDQARGQSKVPGKTLKAKELPEVYHDTSGAWDGIGSFQFGKFGDELMVEWQLCNRGKKSALFSELCRSVDKEGDRRELGQLIADVISKVADREMKVIPGYNDAVRYTAPLRKSESEWRHWASVPAGHMLFDKRKSVDRKSRP